MVYIQARVDDWQWKQLRIRFKAHCRARNAPCWICVERGADPSFARIDYNAAPYDPSSFNADHARSWEEYPHLRYTFENLRASHRRCNLQRGKRPHTGDGEQHGWVKPENW
jgi:5-methylcytosine-specific restriction endonuclease McrA